MHYLLLKKHDVHTASQANLALPAADRAGDWLSWRRMSVEVEVEHKLLIDVDRAITETRKTDEGKEIGVDPEMGWMIKLAVHVNQAVLRYEMRLTRMMDQVEDMEDDDEEDKKGEVANMRTSLKLLGEFNEGLRKSVCDMKEAAAGGGAVQDGMFYRHWVVDES